MSKSPKVHDEHRGNVPEYHTPKSEKAVTKKKRVAIKHIPHMTVAVNPVYPEENFAEKYEFKKKPSPRSPVGGYEHESFERHDEYTEHRPKEARLVRGTPSHYGHSVGQRAGHLRLSGMPGAHRIGARNK